MLLKCTADVEVFIMLHKKKRWNELPCTKLSSLNLKLMAPIAFKVTLGKEAGTKRDIERGKGKTFPRDSQEEKKCRSPGECPLLGVLSSAAEGPMIMSTTTTILPFFPQNYIFHQYPLKLPVSGPSLMIPLAPIE